VGTRTPRSVGPSGRSGAPAVDAMGRHLDRVLGPLLMPGVPCALLGYPNHNNVGDNAIWLGTRRYLHDRGIPLAYTCDLRSYSRDELARRLGGGTILLSGGGSLGDLWPGDQEFREQVVQDFPSVPIVQLPQSIHFADRSRLARAADAFNRHADLTLLVRDGASLERAREAFDVPSELCPDMAVALGPLRRPTPVVDVVWLRRTDREAAHGPLGVAARDVEEQDWTATSRRLSALRAAKRVAAPLGRVPGGSVPSGLGAAGIGHRIFAGSAYAAAALHLRRGRRLLGRGRVVVTERLHGHVLSLLLGIDHVVLDDRYGKLGSFFDTWSAGGGVQRASSPDDALARARALVADGR
jgi:exopolysaccharide biosynthesis predicted pyruvyltransferase EpsI